MPFYLSAAPVPTSKDANINTSISTRGSSSTSGGGGGGVCSTNITPVPTDVISTSLTIPKLTTKTIITTNNDKIQLNLNSNNDSNNKKEGNVQYFHDQNKESYYQYHHHEVLVQQEQHLHRNFLKRVQTWVMQKQLSLLQPTKTQKRSTSHKQQPQKQSKSKREHNDNDVTSTTDRDATATGTVRTSFATVITSSVVFAALAEISSFLLATTTTPISSHRSIVSNVMLAKKIQKFGESSFIGLILVSFLQAFLALVQYRTNPCGELIVPPGLTYGIEKPMTTTAAAGMTTELPILLASSKAATSDTITRNDASGDDCTSSNSISTTTTNATMKSRYMEIMNHINKWLFPILIPFTGGKIAFIVAKYSHLFHLSFILFALRIFGLPKQITQKTMELSKQPTMLMEQKQLSQEQQQQGKSSIFLNNTSFFIASPNDNHEQQMYNTSDHSSQSENRNTKSNNHNDNTGTIMYENDVNKTPRQNKLRFESLLNSSYPSSSSITAATATKHPNPDPFANDCSTSVIVIGDSLAVGLGSVNIFDRAKNNTLPMCRIENIGPTGRRSTRNISNNDGTATSDNSPSTSTIEGTGTSPVLPKAVASALANKLQKEVFWRSAGVDGGDIPAIKKYCLDIIKEEVELGNKPDIVVILCGVNDLKSFFLMDSSNKSLFKMLSPKFWRTFSPATKFRANLISIIKKITKITGEDTLIVLPALPTQIFHFKDSPMNIFPLKLFLDTVVGYWDNQKKIVADQFSNVHYIGLSTSEVSQWYNDDKTNYFYDKKDENCNKIDGDSNYHDLSTLCSTSIDRTYYSSHELGPEEQRQQSYKDPNTCVLNYNEDSVAHNVNHDLVIDNKHDEFSKEDFKKRKCNMKTPTKNGEKPVSKSTLISADGVHPNAKCYYHWGVNICDKVLPLIEK